MNMNEENPAQMPPQMPPDAVLMQMLFSGLIQQSISAVAKLGVSDWLVENAKIARMSVSGLNIENCSKLSVLS